MLNQVLQLTRQFISIKSTFDNPIAREKILKQALIPLSGFTIETFKRNNSTSALVYNTETRPAKFKVLLNAHLDVIPGDEKLYKASFKGNKLYGIGALDMKANAACLIYTFKEIANKVNYPLALQLVTDEEVGGFDGTKYQIERGVKTSLVIAGETTNFNIANQARGIVWTKVTIYGQTAHGAYPWNGINAIQKTYTFLQSLEEKYPTPESNTWKTTINTSRIETPNQTFNKVPDECTVWLDIRYIPQDSKYIISNIKKLLPNKSKLTIVTHEPAMYSSENPTLKLLQTITKATTHKKSVFYGAMGSSDARHFPSDVTKIEFGPIGGGISSDHEWIDTKSLDQYCTILKSYLIKIGGEK